jgi:hypothetical protein
MVQEVKYAVKRKDMACPFFSSSSFMHPVQGRYTNRDLTIEKNGKPGKKARKSLTKVSLIT